MLYELSAEIVRREERNDPRVRFVELERQQHEHGKQKLDEQLDLSLGHTKCTASVRKQPHFIAIC